MLTLWLAAGAPALSAANATVPGALATPYPTLVNLAVEWEISGDDNLDCRVIVSYRKTGSSRWLDGMPLRRIKAGSSTGTDPIFSWKNKLSGSIFDLDPDTGYEIRLLLDDPDGGHAEQTVTARTRPVPAAPADSVVKRADSTTYASVFAAASPGDVILLGRGHYGNGIVYKTGEPGRPIVVRADPSLPDSSVTFDGFNLRSARYVILDGVTVNGKVDLVGADNVAVVRCSVYAGYGIVADRAPGCSNCYIADNVVTWTNTWAGANMGADGTNEGEGIQLTGPGNVICYNRVTGYRDCISTMEDTDASNQVCIDIYNNDIRLGLDDGIESDFCMGNCRIMRNRLTNCFMGLSSQPSLGGPTYFI
ncbi:MAG: right-handed parallel beta-helix repeat-containing protein, partial [Candidatus Glassbacteria bacterium]